MSLLTWGTQGRSTVSRATVFAASMFLTALAGTLGCIYLQSKMEAWSDAYEEETGRRFDAVSNIAEKLRETFELFAAMEEREADTGRDCAALRTLHLAVRAHNAAVEVAHASARNWLHFERLHVFAGEGRLERAAEFFGEAALAYANRPTQEERTLDPANVLACAAVVHRPS